MSRKFKPFEDLTIQDNFMFVKVFSNPETAKPFLEAVLKIKIQKISVVGEYHLDANPQKKRVRFDIFAKEDVGDAVGRTFDIEMQVVDTGELPLRARYYQSICDVETLGTSRRYKELKEQYVISSAPRTFLEKAGPSTSSKTSRKTTIPSLWATSPTRFFVFLINTGSSPTRRSASTWNTSPPAR